MNSNIKKSLTLGLGLAVALILLLNFTGQKYEEVKHSKSGIELSAKHTTPFQDASIPTLDEYNPTANIPVAVSVEVCHEVLCLFTIIYSKHVTFEEYLPDVALPSTKFFHTLFRTFISPNAP